MAKKMKFMCKNYKKILYFTEEKNLNYGQTETSRYT